MKKTLKATVVATAIATLPFGVHAAGLGAINVYSGLGQPLRAEIEVKATAAELQSLTAKVAGVEAFRQANLNYSSSMPNVRMSVERRGNRAFLRVNSNQPINDPFVDLVVELNWASGRVLREYTFLLDPVAAPRPEVATTVTPAVAAQRREALPPVPAMPAQRAVAAAPAAETAVAPAPRVRQAAARPAAQQRATPSRHRVAQGDTLTEIAARYRPARASLDQMLIALLRENPRAFEDGNINRLKSGVILTIPKAAEVRATSAREARQEVLAQTSDFGAYRNRLAGVASTRPATTAGDGSRESAGTIEPRVDAPQAPQGQDRVQVSAARNAVAAAGAGGAGSDARSQQLEEELAAREQALQEANARVKELEDLNADLKRLLDVRNASLAQLQEQAAARPAGADAPAVAPLAAAPAAVEPAKPAEPAVVEPAKPVVEPAVTPPVADDVPPAEVAPPVTPIAPVTPVEPVSPVAELADDEADRLAAETPAAQAAVPPVAAPAPTPAPAPRPRPAPAPQPVVEEPGFFAGLLENPLLLAAGGGGLALVLALAALRARQRRKEAAGLDSLSTLGDEHPSTQSAFGVRGGQAVDTGSTSMMHTDFSQSGLVPIDADEGVDPVAEADVYMAYGRDAQAEEILLDALKADSSRPAIYLKLLEVYASRQPANTTQFEAVAADFYSRTHGEGSDWKKAAEMGRRIDADNPLYRAGPSTGIGARPVAADSVDVPTVQMERGEASSIAAAGFAAGAAAAAAVSELPAMEPDSVPPLQPTATVRRVTPPLLDGDDGDDAALRSTWTVPGDMQALSNAIDLGAAEDITSALEAGRAAEARVEEEEFNDIDTSSLDFNLDLDDDEPHTLPSVPDIGDTAGGLDFDISDMDAPAAPSPVAPEADEPLFVTAHSTTAPVGLTTPVRDISMDVTQIDDVMGDSEIDLEQTGFDNSLMGFDFDLESSTIAKPAESDVPPLDLSSINFDLETPDTQLGDDSPMSGMEQTAIPTHASAGMSLEGDLEHEVDTKLELARAYEEMGDQEGARELIDEILREGSPEQVARAQELAARLG